ncbi:M23 family metallopeptidase [Streptomyces sp. NBC_00237]|uniref:M23 family metallopeptidase n=1 Tax=Streptomyces sp. NBC_00237 TaxID=2975687 RepID=UPI002B1E4FB7|nr:M23 family metallopeptidase [Streptomyces sp. NBC_00237]
MYRMVFLTLSLTVAALFVRPSPAFAAEGPDRSWPVGVRPPVVRAWEPPPSRYAAGHRGVDLAAVPGEGVRAAAAGKVSFAGRVAGRGVLSITLPGSGDPPLRTTYEPVRPLVAEGEEVAAGQVVGVLESGAYHCPAVSCLHWGLLRGADYLDPLSLLPPGLLHRGPPRLLPVFGVPAPATEPLPAAVRDRSPSAAVQDRALSAAVRDGALPVAVLACPVPWWRRSLSPGRPAGPSRRPRR